MTTACGFEFDIEKLSQYYENAIIGEITGLITAGFIFVYIVFMEIINIFENYAEINPQAEWAVKLIKKLRNFSNKKDGD